MDLINKTTSEVIQDHEFKRLYPNTSFPALTQEVLETYGYDIILPSKKPNITDLQTILPGKPVLAAGAYHQAWLVEDKTLSRDEVAGIKKTAFNNMKTAILHKINTMFADEVAALKGGVQQAEIDTFGLQEKEAEAYQADNAAPVPFIAGLANRRGINVSGLAARILTHAAVYKAAMVEIMGKNHSLKDQLSAAETLEDLEKIIVS